LRPDYAGKSAKEIHHLTYENNFNENDGDLKPLCGIQGFTGIWQGNQIVDKLKPFN
jgi:hypothetical protein